jgi:heptose-I-phosphate ethanolaminephosphotransferase
LYSCRKYFKKNPNRKISLWVLFPLLVVLCAGFFIIPDYNYLKEVLAFGVMSLAVFLICAFFVHTRIHKTLIFLSYFFLAFFAFVKLSFYNQYNVPISSSALYVIFETNTGEASDYLSNYFNGVTYLLLLLFLPLLLFLLKNIFKKNNYSTPKESFLYRGLLILGVVGCTYLIQKYYRTQNIPYATIATWDDYIAAKEQLKDALAVPTSKAFTAIESKDIQQTYVILIGESTSRLHMQLYGYARETNPRLTEIKDELVIMDSVITPHVHTILALEKILTLANTENLKPTPNGSIVQLANQAGFTTYWLSNQKPVGIYESIPTIIGSAAKNTRFLATNDYTYNIYDGALLPVLDEVLNDTNHTKKVIFIHLIGTHLAYDKRYPEAFEVFTSMPNGLKFQHDRAITQTNYYDNAVLYNDFIVREIIEKLRNANGYSYLAYFSDHGDEVYDTMDLLGHNEYHGTGPMFEVPLLFWFSQKYMQENPIPFQDYTARRYSLEHFPQTFAQLSGVRFKGYDPSKSVLDSTFITRKRIIKDSIDYDKR